MDLRQSTPNLRDPRIALAITQLTTYPAHPRPRVIFAHRVVDSFRLFPVALAADTTEASSTKPTSRVLKPSRNDLDEAEARSPI